MKIESEFEKDFLEYFQQHTKQYPSNKQLIVNWIIGIIVFLTIVLAVKFIMHRECYEMANIYLSNQCLHARNQLI